MADPQNLEPWVEAALEEYKVHRSMFQETLATAQRTLAFGATAVGILVAGAFQVWDSSERLPATLLFMAFIPLVCVLVIVQWVGQMSLLSARDRYLLQLERHIREAYPRRPRSAFFTWEERYASRYRIAGRVWKPDRRWKINAAMPAFGLLAVGSLGLGVYRGFGEAPVAVVSIGAIEFLVLAIVLGWQAREITTAWSPRRRTRAPRPRSAR
jgi:hypothetical protein